MDQTIKIKKGLDIHLAGRPEETTKSTVVSPCYTVFPDDFAGFVPKVMVKPGEEVVAGAPLMYDKNHPSIQVVSPVSGTVTAIERGAKRKLQSIVIQAEKTNRYLYFGKKEPESLSPETIKNTLARAGILAFIRQRPYDCIVCPEDTPRDIFVPGFFSAPLAPSVEYIIRGREADFQTGLNALAAIASGNVYLSIRPDCKMQALKNAENVRIVSVEGPHPAGNVSVQIHHIRPVNKGEIVWTVNPQDVLLIGCFFRLGIVDMTRLVTLAGSEVNERDRAYYPMITGANIQNLVKCSVTEYIDLRYISGNVLTGTRIGADDSLHAHDNQITVIPEGNEVHDFLGWIKPDWIMNRIYACINPSRKRTEYAPDARIKGGGRAMIMSNEWDRVFPMDILPEFLIRAILAGDTEKMENLGIYEVAPEDFALCEYVDTSKMELQKIVRQGLDQLKMESRK
jgi:Na+-transporting NADH:ubiquinone oxidoreductase subunit A